ncbi:DeoR family transcriptional regulator [Pelagibacteraceae bacterium]|nr:DeoR family transcriptional regulator [Pelagibacteraceae bacterium]
MNKKILYFNKSPKKKDNPNLHNLEKFDSKDIAQVLSANTLILMKYWIKFQQEWVNNIYKQFKDYDKYIVLMYLVSKSWEDDSNLFKFYSMDEYYFKEEIRLPNISLLELSENLKIPKETIRRKLVELEKQKLIKRVSQKILLTQLALNMQKPGNSIKNISVFFEKLSILLSAKDWFGSSVDREDIELYFKKYYTIFWNRYFQLQIPFLVRWKTVFGDLESWVIWANMGINQNIILERNFQKADLKSNNLELKKEVYIANIISMNDNEANESMNGVNASSISEISFIPRATVIRKLDKLLKEKVIKRNKKLEYFLTGKGKLNKKISENYLINQNNIASFVTDIFNLIKKSSLKI